MSNFPITRIALNLSLIVALMIQPMAVSIAHASGASRCGSDSGQECSGCGCCEVALTTVQTCCGTSVDRDEEDASESSCCADLEVEPQSLLATDDSTQIDERSSAPARVRSVCLCERESQPLSDSSNRTTRDHRLNVTVLFSVAGSGVDAAQSISGVNHISGAPVLSHFTQVLLCVWRL